MKKKVWVSMKLMGPMRGEREPVDDDERGKIKEHEKKNSFHSSFNSLSAELRKKSKKSVKVMNKATARIREKQKLCENAVLQ